MKQERSFAAEHSPVISAAPLAGGAASRYLTEAQAARELGVAARTLRAWRRERPPRIRFVKWSHKVVRYLRTDIAAAVARHTVEGRREAA